MPQASGTMKHRSLSRKPPSSQRSGAYSGRGGLVKDYLALRPLQGRHLPGRWSLERVSSQLNPLESLVNPRFR